MNRKEIAFDVSWEIDLWGRLSNRSEAAELKTVAAEEDLENLALLVSFELAKIYYELVEQRLQSHLLDKQMEVNSIYLNLVELRFANGAASVVDVYQQRQLLTGKKAKMVVVKERIVSLENRLRVLMGMVPGSGAILTTDILPALPQLPQLGVPADLLQNRPDLRSLNAELKSSYYSVAAAVAERLPQVRIGGSAGLVDGDIFYSLFGDAFAAIIDWNKRKSEVERQKAVAWEKASLYAEAYLTAVEEVENSLWREHYHRSLILTLEQQLNIAKGTLRESRNRYMQGVTDYLPVLAALQTMQELEFGYLQRQRELVENRVVLYRALGGSVIDRKEAVSSFLLDKE
jgi:outer membrane protein TolC